MMKVDMRIHSNIREQVSAGVVALLVQGRQIWGTYPLVLPEIVVRLMVTVGDIARIERDSIGQDGEALSPEASLQLKKELGNIILSTIRWIDDLGLNALECLDLAIEAQEKFVQSGRPR